MIEVFKTIHDINISATSTMFSVKDSCYSLRNPYPIEQTYRNTTTYGLRTLSYLGANLWNSLPLQFKQITTLNEFKSQLKNWKGPPPIDFDNCL